MKKLFTFLFISCALFVLNVNAQYTFTFDFNEDKDFKADGIAGTQFSGFYVNIDDADAADTNLIELNTTSTDGALTITAHPTFWSYTQQEGIFLYKDLKGANFDAKVKIVGGTIPGLGDTIGYFMPGLMVRAKDDETSRISSILVFDQFNARFRAYNAPFDVYNGIFAENDDVVWVPGQNSFDSLGLDDEALKVNIINYPWIRLLKEDDYVSAYFSADAQTWYKVYEADRSDMADYDLEVGLSHSSFGGDSCTVVFDDLSIYDPNATPVGVSQNTADREKILCYYNGNASTLYIKGLDGLQVKSVDLISVDGKVVIAKKDSNVESLDILGLTSGIYIVHARLSDETNYMQKVLIY